MEEPGDPTPQREPGETVSSPAGALPPAPTLSYSSPFLVFGTCMLLCKVEVCFHLIGFARIFLVSSWEVGHGLLFITPSLKTSSSLVDTVNVRQNLCFLLLGNAEGRSSNPPASLPSRTADKDEPFICSFTISAGGDFVLSAVSWLDAPDSAAAPNVPAAYSTLAMAYIFFFYKPEANRFLNVQYCYFVLCSETGVCGGEERELVFSRILGSISDGVKQSLV